MGKSYWSKGPYERDFSCKERSLSSRLMTFLAETADFLGQVVEEKESNPSSRTFLACCKALTDSDCS